MIKISEKAAKQVTHVLNEEEEAKKYLRIKAVKGGCSGLSYKLDFDNDKQENDKTFEEHGVMIVVDTSSYLYLVGMTLDYEGGLNGQGFVFNNPNATKTCSCGASFGV